MSSELSLLERPAPAPDEPTPHRWRLAVVLVLVVIALTSFGVTIVLARLGRPFVATPFIASTTGASAGLDQAQLRRRMTRAQKELERVQPRGLYIVIDTYENRISLVKDGEVVRAAVCSTGTGALLKDPRNEKQWVFDTPMGEMTILDKRKNPVWAKPDWAFIEEGLIPPPPGAEERFDNFSLGDYALYMRDGYIIHGTVFKSLLGRRVTHGCIRVGDDDLKFIYENVPIGTRVYLY
jgi:L,D-transpeptidase ErfK/SrfK